MVTRLLRYFNNAIKFIRSGGLVQLNIAYIQYDQVLEGKRVLITGGSSGIGFAIAKKFLAVGAKVVITGRNRENLLVAKELLNHENLFTFVWDIVDISLIEENINKVHALLGGIDIMVNNAGILFHKQFEEVNQDVWNKTIDTNLKSIFFTCQYICKYFISINNRKESKIINISSMSGFIAEPNPYNISKFALNALTAGLAKKYASQNIIINGIAPGATVTSMNPQDVNSNAYRKLNNKNNRIALPEEIAELALFLAGDASNNIIGQTIIIDGGESIL